MIVIFTIMTMMTSILIAIKLIGCGSKERPSHSTRSMQKSDPSPKSLQAKPPVKQVTPNLTPMPSKMGDDGGYESCPDMTPSELAKAADMNVNEHAANPVAVK
ncbi:hypothetical protein DICVIV_06527 [Dictyocaulus viviparus]|uniref:Secreted protein n=1 Tax=Dictyocaulus viviparus TaxID=29172 RepID=A0A0D8XYG9_DICVI|nr:hypothetical protein DICVIV_06527 [Dictyocaulus viviparus]